MNLKKSKTKIGWGKCTCSSWRGVCSRWSYRPRLRQCCWPLLSTCPALSPSPAYPRLHIRSPILRKTLTKFRNFTLDNNWVEIRRRWRRNSHFSLTIAQFGASPLDRSNQNSVSQEELKCSCPMCCWKLENVGQLVHLIYIISERKFHLIYNIKKTINLKKNSFFRMYTSFSKIYLRITSSL